jgi:hypothetical protein
VSDESTVYICDVHCVVLEMLYTVYSVYIVVGGGEEVIRTDRVACDSCFIE